MSKRLFIDNYETTLTEDVTDTETALSLSDTTRVSGLPLKKHDIAAGERGAFVAMTISPDGVSSPDYEDLEVVWLYQVVGDSGYPEIYVERGMEGTAAKAWPAGSLASARYTATAAAGGGVLWSTFNPDAVLITRSAAADAGLGSNSVSIGNGAAAQGYRSVAIGNAQVKGQNVVSVGNTGNQVTVGEDAVNLGGGGVRTQNLWDGVSGRYNVSIGAGGVTSSTSSMGRSNVSLGSGGVNGASADTNASINIGSGGTYDPGIDDWNKDGPLNIGSGGASDPDAVNIGVGGAYGDRAFNVGSAGAGAGNINIGYGGGAYAPAAAPGINLGSTPMGASGLGAISMGHGETGGTDGDYAIAVGFECRATDGNAIAIGHLAAAGHSNSVAIGSETETTDGGQFAVGDRDIELGSGTSSRGLHLYSPDGTRYKVTVDNTGALTVAADALIS